VTAKSTKENRAETLAKWDSGTPVIHQKNMQWKPSELAIASHHGLLKEVNAKLKDADSARLRNALRSERRLIERVLAKAKRKKCWRAEVIHTRHTSVQVFVSPKNHRYVLASDDLKADLIVKNRKTAALPFTRLLRFEKSQYPKLIAQQKKAAEAATKKQKERKAAKKSKQTQSP
jgi:hydroxylamine reductase (hybrid-cluster protein)